jgi:hypothetical protein
MTFANTSREPLILPVALRWRAEGWQIAAWACAKGT